jgi:2-(1,2-epoxy-1,2-dihydrophenyl)acetyl-CoA isomerase
VVVHAPPAREHAPRADRSGGAPLSALRVEQDGALLRLTLDRPDKRNALSPDLVRALLAALDRAAKDAAVRAVFLTGAGAAFCAGGDIDAMLARRGDALATKKAQDELFAALARAILLLEKPVVCFVNGDAFGAGLMLVLACDHAIADPKARFAASFVKVGLVPDTAGTWLLPKTLGLRHARELALLAETFDAKRAEALSVVNGVGTIEDALAVARRFADGPTRALGLAKRALVLGTSDGLDGALAREAAFQALLFTTRDHAEGADAFLEKRTPKFDGS